MDKGELRESGEVLGDNKQGAGSRGVRRLPGEEEGEMRVILGSSDGVLSSARPTKSTPLSFPSFSMSLTSLTCGSSPCHLLITYMSTCCVHTVYLKWIEREGEQGGISVEELGVTVSRVRLRMERLGWAWQGWSDDVKGGMNVVWLE